jgi:hypothetical protein
MMCGVPAILLGGSDAYSIFDADTKSLLHAIGSLPALNRRIGVLSVHGAISAKKVIRSTRKSFTETSGKTKTT